jgi:hypothetical protein
LLAAFGGIPDRKKRRGEKREETAKEIIKGKLFSNRVSIGSEVFELQTVKGKKQAVLPWEKLVKLKESMKEETARKDPLYKGMRGVIVFENKFTLLNGEKLKLILSLLPALDLTGSVEKKWPQKRHFNSWENLDELLTLFPHLLSPALWKKDRRELGFLTLCTDGAGSYRIVCSRGFHTGLNESIASLEALIDEMGEEVDIGIKHIVNQTYRRLSDLI